MNDRWVWIGGIAAAVAFLGMFVPVFSYINQHDTELARTRSAQIEDVIIDPGTRCATAEKLRRIPEGANLRQAQEIMGCKGEFVMEQDLGGGQVLTSYRWHAENNPAPMAAVAVFFTKGRASMKQNVGVQ